MKLFQIVQADRAYFGEKDAQQLAIVRRLVTDFSVPVTVVGVPTVRESDGLALSSRNQHLSPDERRLAPTLYQALGTAERLIVSGATDVAAIKAAVVASLPEYPSLRLEYLEIVEPDEMQPVAEVTAPVLVAAALWVGGTRLIDNVWCAPARGGA
jgi:pantoate--beta-alanine ligase